MNEESEIPIPEKLHKFLVGGKIKNVGLESRNAANDTLILVVEHSALGGHSTATLVIESDPKKVFDGLTFRKIKTEVKTVTTEENL